jgi:tetratricopeptide (TPR) repeat protein
MTIKRRTNKTIEYEIRFYEGILRSAPNFVEALMALADLYTRRGCFQKGLIVDERLIRLRPESPEVFYNLACSYSLTGQPDKAFWAVKQAVKFGYDRLDHLESDPDLAGLRADPRFVKYYARIKQTLSVDKPSEYIFYDE